MIRLGSLILVVGVFLLLATTVVAETTFFDNPSDLFIISTAPVEENIKQISGGGWWEDYCDENLELSVPKNIIVDREENITFNITLRNNGICLIRNINISVGSPFTENQREIIDTLSKNEEKIITYKLTPLMNIQNDYSITITIATVKKYEQKEVEIIVKQTREEKTAEDISKKVIIKNILEKTREQEENNEKENTNWLKDHILFILIVAITIMAMLLERKFHKKFKNY